MKKKSIITDTKHFILDTPYKRTWKSFALAVYYKFQTIYYRLRLSTIHVNAPDKKYKVSICAIFKNEAPYLREWLEFNHIVGVEHFYMYNNNSEDDFRPVLAPYIEKGWATLIEWPYDQQQMECYKDCIKNFSGETKWLGFIDIDEFIVPKSTDNIYDYLKRFEQNRGSVKLYWRLYGSSGKMTRNLDGLVTEDFTVCWPKYSETGKCFYNTAFGFDADSQKNGCLHHSFWAKYNKNIPPINIFDHVCVGNINRADGDDFPIQLNHYFTKSYNEYAMKRAKGDVFFKNNPHDEAYFYEHEMKCTSMDYSAYKYLTKLKLAMNKE